MTHPAFPDLVIRRYQPGDEHEILKTFNRVFRETNGEGFVDRSLEQWRWQYLDNHVGQRMSLAVDKDGTVASQYAGVPLRVDSPWGRVIFVHCVDSMSHPDYRQGLKRPGLFVTTGLPFSAYSRDIGDAVLYGYPVRMAERIGSRYLEYHFLRVVDYLIADPASARFATAPAGIDVRECAEVPVEVDALYGAVRKDKQLWLTRDRRYLDWRYVQIPGDDYRMFAAWRDDELVGFQVLRPEHELAPGACTIADWVVRSDDEEVMDALLGRAAALARENGREKLMAVFANPSGEHAALQERGFDVVPSGNWMERRLTYLITGTPITEDLLADHWWYTLGDSDLV